MAKCEHCGGLITPNSDGEERCASCGREGTPPVQSPGQGLTIALQLQPKTLTELYGGLAMARGVTPTELLGELGLPKGQGNRMASGQVIYPGAAVALMERFGITPSDFVVLMKGTVRVQPPAKKRSGRPPKQV